MHTRKLIVLVLILNLAMVKSASAYIGPGIALISYLFGPVVAVVTVVGMVLYLPIKKLLKKWKQRKGLEVAESQEETS